MQRKHLWVDLSSVDSERHEDKDEEDAPTVLELTHFAPTPHLSFGKVWLGSTKILPLVVMNPHNVDLCVSVLKCPQDKGFSLEMEQFTVKSASKEEIKITWNPSECGNSRGLLQLKTNAGQKVQVVLLGTAAEKQAKKARSAVGMSLLAKKRPRQMDSSGVNSGSRSVSHEQNQTKSLKRITPEILENEENHYGGKKNKSELASIVGASATKKNEDDAAQRFAKQDFLHSLPSTPVRRETFFVRTPGDIARSPFQELPTSENQFVKSPNKDMPVKRFISRARKRLSSPRRSATVAVGNQDRRETFLVRKCQSESVNRISMTSKLLPEPDSRDVDLYDSLTEISEKNKVSLVIDEISHSVPDIPVTQQQGFFLHFNEDECTGNRDSLLIRRSIFGCKNLLNETELHENRYGMNLEYQDQNVGDTSANAVPFLLPVSLPNTFDRCVADSPAATEYNARIKLLESIVHEGSLADRSKSYSQPSACNETFVQHECVALSTIPEESSNENRGLTYVVEKTFIKPKVVVTSTHDSQKSDCGPKHIVEPNNLPVPSNKSTEDKLAYVTSTCIGILDWSLTSPGDDRRCSTGIKAKVAACPERERSATTHRKLFPDSKTLNTGTSTVSDQVQEEKSENIASRTTWFSISPPKIIEINKQPTAKLRNEETNIKNASSTSGTTQKKSPFKKVASKIKKGLAQTKLTLMKPTKSEVIRHPNPFAAKNIYYDELWKEKQELAFTRWMNFVLSPPEEFNTSNVNVEVNAAKLWIDSLSNSAVNRAPTKEDISLQAYTAIQHLNRLRRSACLLFQSKEMASVINRLEAEICQKRLLIREDRGLHADYGIKQHILSMLLCYNPLWLRIGLETLYGELLPLASNIDIIGLSTFIVSRFLYSPELASKYGHPSVANLFRAGFEEELKIFILKKFLLLVLFLDTAKVKHLIDHDPCLFNKNAKIKSSRVMILAFCKEYLKGEGDILRHLRYLDYRVEWEQKPREEFDYSVTNIAADLRCGLRIARVIELTLHSWDLTSRLRAPAASRLQKITNMEIVFKELRQFDFEIESTLTPRDIVDGHREKTLQLVWKLIFKSQVEVLIDKKRLKSEIKYLTRSLTLFGRNEDILDCKGIRPLEIFKQVQRDCIDPKNDKLSLLLTWAQAVCAHYKVQLENFGASFADGRAFCYIIHHYHPDLLHRDDICSETTLTRLVVQSSGDANDSLSASCPFMLEYTSTEMQKALLNEKTNLNLAFDKMKALGGIPILTRSKFMSNTIPDEKVVITLLTYLHARLLSLSEEIRAARTIQLAWRNKQLTVKMELKKAQDKAARLIQQHVKAFLERRRLAKRNLSALMIQCAWRHWNACTRLQALRREKLLAFHHKMALVIQVAFRRHLLEKEQFRTNKSAILIQSSVRGWFARRQYCKNRQAAIVIQERFRAMKIGRLERDQLKTLKHSAVVIQSHFRGLMARKSYRYIRGLIVCLQSRIRGHLVRQNRSKVRQAAIQIQQAFRGHIRTKACRKDYLEKRNACLVLQRTFRAHLERKKFCKQKACAILMQSHIRGFLAKRRYQKKRSAVLVLQQRWKATIAAKKQQHFFLRYRHAAIVIQTRYRALLLALSQRQECEKAAVLIQASFRMVQARKKYLLLKNTVRRIEMIQVAKLSMRLQRKEFLRQKSAAITVQRMFRAYRQMKLCKEKYVKEKRAAVVLQKFFRACKAKRKFVKQIASAVILQSHIRAFLARRNYLKMKLAANVIQLHWRATMIAKRKRQNFLRERSAAIVIQSYFRMWIKKKSFLCKKLAAITIQTHYRAMQLARMQRKEYLKKQSACIIMQRSFRGYRMMTLCKNEYHMKKLACVVLQKCFRAHKDRKRFLKQKAAATMIQSYVRCLLSSRRYKRLKEATQVIQSKWKATLLARTERRVFIKKQAAVKLIQSQHRAWKERRTFLRTKQAAISIQRQYRMLMLARFQRQEYLTLRSAVVTIQRSFRGYRMMTICRNEYHEKRVACLVLQKSFRAYKGRKSFLKQKAAVTMIQSHTRCFLSSRRYKRLKEATQVIQSKWKATLLARMERNIFIEKKDAVNLIQSHYRAWKARRTFLRYKQSAVAIQRWYRSLLLAKLQKRKYLNFRSAAITIQRSFRRYRMMTLCRYEYHEKRAACLVLQKSFRAYKARKSFLKQKAAATTIQSCVRRLHSSRKYQKLKATTLVIQLKWRATVLARKERDIFMRKKNAVKIIQSHYHSWNARRSFLRYKQSAVSIQRWYRSLLLAKLQKRKYLHLRSAAITIQRSFRSYRKKIMCRKEYLRKEMASIVLQKSFKAYMERKNFLKLKAATIKIQSYVRCFLLSKRYQILKQSVQVIQLKWKATMVARKERQIYLRYRKASINIQTRYRAKLLARSQRQKYTGLRNAVVTLQSLFRMKRIRGKYLILKNTVRKIETLRVAKLSLCSQRNRFLTMRHAAVTIQRAFRGFRQMKVSQADYLKKKEACIVLQKWFRACKERKSFLQKKAAAVKLQSHIRCFLACRQYQKLKHAAKVIQIHWRSTLAARQAHHDFLEKENAAKVIQSHFRSWKARRTFLRYRQTAIVIQTNYRALLLSRFQRREYLRLRMAVVLIQQTFLGYMKMKQCRIEFLRKKMACVVLQRAFREHCRKNLQKQNDAAVILQKLFRCHIQRKDFNKRKQAAITLQAALRMILAKKRYMQLQLDYQEKRQDMQQCMIQQEKAAFIIQKIVRKCHELRKKQKLQERKKVLDHIAALTYRHLCVIRIQRLYRKRRALLQARAEEEAVVVIQRWSRRCLLNLTLKQLRLQYQQQQKAVLILQSAVRNWLTYCRQKKSSVAASKIQACWRGYKQRCSEVTCHLALIRSRLSDATATATDDKKLHFRTSRAIDTILHSKDTTRICLALLSLDRITALDGKCCERVGEAGLVDIVVEVMRRCNRSLTHVEIITYAINVLMNLAKYDKTIQYIWSGKHLIDTVLNLMKIYSEKPGIIFRKLCTLLWILVRDPKHSEFFLAKKSWVSIICAVNSNLRKKVEQAATQQKKQKAHCSSQMWAPGDDDAQSMGRMLTTPALASTMDRSPIIFKPAWFLNRRNISEFGHPVQAITAVIQTLKLNP